MNILGYFDRFAILNVHDMSFKGTAVANSKKI